MEQPKVPNASRIIASLNSLSLGKMEAIGDKLDEVRKACLELEETDLADRLGQARGALLRGDVKTYRKRVESVISRLGHRR
jgi:hypothetical protein